MKSKMIEAANSERAHLLNLQSMEEFAAHQAAHQHRLELKKESLRAENEQRLIKCARAQRSKEYREQALTEQWEEKRQKVAAQEQELRSMTSQLRQEKIRLQVRTNHLQRAQTSNDMGTLASMISHLDLHLQGLKGGTLTAAEALNINSSTTLLL
jgi:hypothetical protein